MLANQKKPAKPAGFQENRRTTGFGRTVWFNVGRPGNGAGTIGLFGVGSDVVLIGLGLNGYHIKMDWGGLGLAEKRTGVAQFGLTQNRVLLPVTCMLQLYS
jgi:hypothetical protein